MKPITPIFVKIFSMKKMLLLLLAITTAAITKAQNNASQAASQTAVLSLGNVVQISAFGGPNGGNSTVELPILDANSMNGAIESPEFTLSISSTSGFDVKAKADAEYFTYTGPSTFPPAMKVSDVLALKVSNNNTTATISGGHEQYQPISGLTGSPILINGAGGSNQTLGVKYRSMTGYNYPAGIYTVDITYTITQY